MSDPDRAMATESTESPLSPFAPGAPDIALGGITIEQAIIQPHIPKGLPDSDEQKLTLTYFCTPGAPNADADEDDPQRAFFVVHADLRIARRPWFVGAIAAANVLFRHADDAPPRNADGANELLKSVGPWAGHVLYDLAANTARTLVASAQQCTIEVPRVTPQPQWATIQPAKTNENDDDM